jgi:hypothetical protein
MALPDYFKLTQGTAIVWGEAGGTSPTVTKTLSLDALGIGAAQRGASADLGPNYDQEYAVYLWVETGTAPTAGTTVELYLACSHDNTIWPGKVTGADGVYASGAVPATKRQLGPPVSVLIATADSNTILYQAPVLWRPKARYVAPVVVNLLGVSFRDETTASDNGSRVVLVPIIGSIQDA